MSAETLRRAAAAIRKDQDIEENLGHIGQREFDTWLAVADWLDDEADACISRLSGLTFAPREHALAVARAYLGSDA